ncbi:MAG TPA: putative toxin-antitoxin system toxin component, PIN family [Puia sp.]|nr:putative toxin-antitoxin system toxin component, PIN family [Puia sp.]
MAPKAKWRVFLDTSAFVAGVVSAKGAAREVLRLAEAQVIELVLSEQVLVEMDRVLEEKFPDHIHDFRVFVKKLRPEVVDDPDQEQLSRFQSVIEKGDVAILAAAHSAKVDGLVTGDKNDFLKPKVKDSISFPVFDPGEFLKVFREWLDKR